VAQRFTAAIQALNFDGFSRWGTVSFKLTHYPTPPTLTNNARMVHPQWEWRIQRSLKVGHPPG